MKSNEHHRKARILAAALLGSTALTGGLAMRVMAQDAPPAAEEAATPDADAAVASGAELVVVTASRRAQRAIDVPYNISAIPGAEIEDRKILDVPELIRTVPGVSMVDRGYRNAGVLDGIRIRGINTDSAALGDYAVSAVGAISQYTNDTPIYANFLLRDIARVEVLRGPQGTLYGSGALGGTVRFISRAPEIGEFYASGAFSGSSVTGSDGTGGAADVTLNIPLGETMAFRATGSIISYPGLTDYVNVYVLDATGAPKAPNGVLNSDAQYRAEKDADDVDIWFVRGSLLFRPSDRFEATLTGVMQSDDIGGRRQQTPGTDGFGNPYDDYENGSVMLEPSSRDVWVGALEMNLDLGFATLTSSSSLYDHEGESISENTGFYAKAGFLAFYYNYPRPMAVADRTYHDEAYVQEVRLVSNEGDGPVDYVVGLFYQDQDRASTQDSYLRGFKRWWDTAFPGFAAAVTGDQDFLYVRNETFEDFALFGEVTWHVTPSFDLTGGLRWFSNESTNNTLIDLPLYAALSNPTLSTFTAEEDGTLFKLNAAWRFAENQLAFATVSEGYRRGGSNAVPTIGFFAEDPAWQVYDSDRVTNYEIGIKGETDGIIYSASVFYIDWTDPQLNTATPFWGFYAVSNGESARSSGFDASVSGSTEGGTNWSFGLTWADAELTDDFISPTGTVLGSDGARLPASPELSLTGALDHTWTVLGGYDLTARLDGYYQSETENSISNSVRFRETLDGFAIFNASLTLARDNWDLTLWGKNIFNEEGITGVFKEEYMGSEPAVGYFGNGAKELIALPATIGLTLTAHH